MLQKSSREESLGCLFGLVGGLVGFFIGVGYDRAATEAMRAADPDVFIDFLPVMPFWGMFLGGLFATMFGMILSRVLPPERPDKGALTSARRVGHHDAPPDRGRILLTLLAANIVTSILHYVDNVVSFREYQEPTWLSPHLVALAWFVMIPCGVAGYLLYLRGRLPAAFACLYLYAAMGLLVLGHYLIAPPWEVSLKINLFIMAEAAAALLLGVFTAGLQFQGEGGPSA